MKKTKKIIIILGILLSIPILIFSYHYIRIKTYDKEQAKEIWEERIETLINNDTISQEKVIRTKLDSLKR